MTASCTVRAHPPSPRGRGEGRDDLVVGAARRQPRVRGSCRMRLLRKHPRTLAPAFASAHFIDDKVDEVLSPPAGRGEARASCGNVRT
ncbi:hypothetical protein DK412_19515 [Methylobacterium sp. 17Sr1-1]|nr:hypothetical protein DK412_19515 [Methylobacterium sp. 17Sr1-1]